MGPLEQMVLGWECGRAALRTLGWRAVWALWVPLVLWRLAMLGAMTRVAHPRVSRWSLPLAVAIGGPGAAHYPGLFRVLPRIHAHLDAVTLALAGVWVAGAASVVVASRSGGAPRGAGLAALTALGRLPTLLLTELPWLLILWGLTDGLGLWVAMRGSSALVIKLLTLIAAVVLVLVRGYFAWLPPLVAAGACGLRDVPQELSALTSRGYLTALTITVFAALPSLPLWVLLRAPDHWVDGGHPEWVALLAGAQIGVTWLASLLATSALTLAWQAYREEP